MCIHDYNTRHKKLQLCDYLVTGWLVGWYNLFIYCRSTNLPTKKHQQVKQDSAVRVYPEHQTNNTQRTTVLS